MRGVDRLRAGRGCVGDRRNASCGFSPSDAAAAVPPQDRVKSSFGGCMNFLYGDSSTSRLTSNFLEFLRDAIDFAVFVLESDERIAQGKKAVQALMKETEAEMDRLEAFIRI